MPRPYRSFSGSMIDPEKQYHSYDDDTDSTKSMSSRSTSGSDSPMLKGLHSLPTHHVAWSRRFPQRRFTRYFTLFISTSLVLFIFFLVNASWTSQAEVQAGNLNIADIAPEWEQFPLLQRYYGGIRTLIDRSTNDAEYPLSDDLEADRLEELAMQRKINDEVKSHLNSKRQEWQFRTSRFDPLAHFDETRAEKPIACHLNGTSMPQLLAYNGVPKGFPNPVMGSYEVLGLENDFCFDRYGRLGPYGYGYSKTFGGSSAGMDGDTQGSAQVWAGELEVDWREVSWIDAQQDCLSANAHRFRSFRQVSEPNHWMSLAKRDDESIPEPADDQKPTVKNEKRLLPRTAVLIRTWSDYNYDDEDMFNLRAMINELTLQSGGEYVVHFLIHVKDNTEQIWADEGIYQKVLQQSLPQEFSGMGTLWSEQQMNLIYGGLHDTLYRDLSVHGVYRSSFMPVQYFAHTHSEYDFIWNWEMDVRYTGHFYHLLDRSSSWAQQQPRKGLWERSARFYVPSKHGTYEDFRQMVRVQTEHGTASRPQSKFNNEGKTLDDKSQQLERPIWGALAPENDTLDASHDPVPPRSYEKDNYEWGVGEDADFLSFNPLFDPKDTEWLLAGDVTGYNSTLDELPRRSTIGTTSRLSRRLLQTMHRETAVDRRTMFSEMWPATCALHHSFKAVYVPHPVYIDRAWPTSYLAAIFNNGRNGASGGARTSVFSEKRQHNFKGTTWYYDAVFGATLWQRWLGYKVDEQGGEEFEVQGDGRMCLPPMLLHPVKQIDLIIERASEEVQVKASPDD